MHLIGKYHISHYKGHIIYVVKNEKDNNMYSQGITMIEPDAGWIEIRSALEAQADLVAI